MMAIPPWFVGGAALRQRWSFARPYVIEREGFGQGGDCGDGGEAGPGRSGEGRSNASQRLPSPTNWDRRL